MVATTATRPQLRFGPPRREDLAAGVQRPAATKEKLLEKPAAHAPGGGIAPTKSSASGGATTPTTAGGVTSSGSTSARSGSGQLSSSSSGHTPLSARDECAEKQLLPGQQPRTAGGAGGANIKITKQNANVAKKQELQRRLVGGKNFQKPTQQQAQGAPLLAPTNKNNSLVPSPNDADCTKKVLQLATQVLPFVDPAGTGRLGYEQCKVALEYIFFHVDGADRRLQGRRPRDTWYQDSFTNFAAHRAKKSSRTPVSEKNDGQQQPWVCAKKDLPEIARQFLKFAMRGGQQKQISGKGSSSNKNSAGAQGQAGAAEGGSKPKTTSEGIQKCTSPNAKIADSTITPREDSNEKTSASDKKGSQRTKPSDTDIKVEEPLAGLQEEDEVRAEEGGKRRERTATRAEKLKAKAPPNLALQVQEDHFRKSEQNKEAAATNEVILPPPIVARASKNMTSKGRSSSCEARVTKQVVQFAPISEEGSRNSEPSTPVREDEHKLLQSVEEFCAADDEHARTVPSVKISTVAPPFQQGLLEQPIRQQPQRSKIVTLGLPKFRRSVSDPALRRKSVCINSEVVIPSYDEAGQVYHDFELCSKPEPAGTKKAGRASSTAARSADIGKGAFGSVKLVRSKKSKFRRACKQVKIENKADRDLIHTEIETMKSLDHPHVCRLYRCYFERASIFLLLEFCEQGTLDDAIKTAVYVATSSGGSGKGNSKADRLTRGVLNNTRTNGGGLTVDLHQQPEPPGRCPPCFSLERAANYTKQILSALAYCHSRNLLHRDIKPENILLSNGVLKIIDFGLADFLDRIDSRMRCGTCHYMAPEIHTSCKYSAQSDVFAIGVLLFVMLTGVHPFFEPGRDDYKSCRGRIVSTDPDWRRFLSACMNAAAVVKHNKPTNAAVDPNRDEDKQRRLRQDSARDAKHFCAKLLEKDPRRRLAARQAISYPFVTNNVAAVKHQTRRSGDLIEQLFRGLFLFARLDRLTQATLRLMAKELDEPHISDEFRTIFSLMDRNGDGLVNRMELLAAAQGFAERPEENADCPDQAPPVSAPFSVSREDGMRLAAALGSQGSESLTYRDLLAAAWLLPLGRSASRRAGDVETGARLLADIFPRFASCANDGLITRASLRYSLAPSAAINRQHKRATGLNGFDRISDVELDEIFRFYHTACREEVDKRSTVCARSAGGVGELPVDKGAGAAAALVAKKPKITICRASTALELQQDDDAVTQSGGNAITFRQYARAFSTVEQQFADCSAEAVQS
ncbi:unnamed protein product [Amoebophrya sp. A120]|nr:unnamed protein product [Amoebophrya sp. A120]|eukprot:GSA120T00005065001.1